MKWVGVGAWMLAASIGAGAFGAHGLESRLEPAALGQWETASKYLAYAAVALMLMGLSGSRTESAEGLGAWPGKAAVAVGVGALIFSGTVFGLALGGPRFLGAITPIGGVSMIAGLVVFGLGAIRR